MKENKFRGKNIFNYEWVYGYYFYDKFTDKHYIFQAQEDEEEPFMYEVIPETVGQYTGLKDKNDKGIYEGDIYDIGMCTKIIRDNNFIEDVYELINMINNKASIEVIGNVSDNPELTSK